jgi:hypothetical protein
MAMMFPSLGLLAATLRARAVSQPRLGSMPQILFATACAEEA